MTAWRALALTLVLRVFVAVLAAIAGGAIAGCATPPGGERAPGIFAQTLAGTDDVELTYEIEPNARVPVSAAFGEDLRAVVLRRLGAAQIGADVTAEERRVHIVVDEMRAPRVDELVTWTGTLLVYDPAPENIVLAPRDASSGLVLATSEGGRERWYEGSRADVLRALDAWPIDRTYRILGEPLRATGEASVKWRTRVVLATPSAGELGDGALVSWGDGPTLRVRGVDGSTTRAALATARERPVSTIIARGRISFGPAVIGSDATLTLRFGAGAEAYARAQQERHLLATARLPPLRRVDAIGLPPNRELATASLLLPVALSLAWLLFVRRFDRAHPEPIWLIGVTFLLGAVSTAPAGLCEYLIAKSSPWLDPSLATFGGQVFAFPLALAVFVVVVGLSEEGAKRLAAQFAFRRTEFDEPVDGIIYGIVASLGFAAAENIRYFAIGRLNAPLVIARCFMSVPAHMFFGALWGYAVGMRLVDRSKHAWTWLLLAAGCHGLYDALLSTEGGGTLAILLNVLLASVFVILVRDALRHGVVAEEMRSIRPEDRDLFRVGRPVLFWLSAVLLHVLAFGIFALGAYYQLARHRPSTAFVVGSSLMLALLGFAALGVSQTLPLDVAVDAYGVTFAGAARPWRKIRAFVTKGDHVELDCEGGPILLGPGPPEVIAAIAKALEQHLGASGKDRITTLQSRPH